MNSAPSGAASPAPRHGSLADLLRMMIAQEGPISVERYMALALGHPTHGYYMTRDPFGQAGDFTTAPEISQMFGELLGLWAAEVWDGMGRPDPVRLVELGPGRGTLMADALRAARAVPAFRAAIDLHLVETSPVLRAAQERVLPNRATWHAGVESLPEGPAVILTNEFFDALPIRQYLRTPRGWCERLVGLGPDGALAFGLAALPEPSLAALDASGSRAMDPGVAEAGIVFEVCPAGQRIMRTLATHLGRHGGALLAIDYGHARSGFADTLQAVRAHRFVDSLADPGAADLTAHVDFQTLARVAAAHGLAVHGPVNQGDFLLALGLAHRAEALKAKATGDQGRAIDAAVARLTGPAPGMGDLFKVLAVGGRDMPTLPGFAWESRS